MECEFPPAIGYLGRSPVNMQSTKIYQSAGIASVIRRVRTDRLYRLLGCSDDHNDCVLLSTVIQRNAGKTPVSGDIL